MPACGIPLRFASLLSAEFRRDKGDKGEYRDEVIFLLDSPEFQALRLEYMQSVLERCGYLEDAAQALQTNQAVDLVPLRNEVHKIRGSGGFYGFAHLSERAALAEDLIMQIRAGEAILDNPTLASRVLAIVDTARAAAKSVGL